MIENLTDEQAKFQSLVENIHRQNLTPLEMAKAFQGILKIKSSTLGPKDKGYKWLSTKIPLGETRISSIMSLVDSPESIKNKVHKAIEKKTNFRRCSNRNINKNKK